MLSILDRISLNEFSFCCVVSIKKKTVLVLARFLYWFINDFRFNKRVCLSSLCNAFTNKILLTHWYPRKRVKPSFVVTIWDRTLYPPHSLWHDWELSLRHYLFLLHHCIALAFVAMAPYILALMRTQCMELPADLSDFVTDTTSARG